MAVVSNLLLSLLSFLVALGVLISVHEFGHFWVARRCGVKVLTFSLGFGQPLWQRRFGVDRTEFRLAAIPLGGYVRMLDEREEAVDASERHRAFNRQSLSVRSAVVLAGPAFNFLFAAFAYWLVLMIGTTALKAMVGEVSPGSLAAEAGFAHGDRIVAVGKRETPTWPTALEALLPQVIDGSRVEITVERGGGRSLLELDLGRLERRDTRNLLGDLGLSVLRPTLPAVVGGVVEGSPAQLAGLRSGDRVLRIDGELVDDWNALVAMISARPGESLQLHLSRDGERLQQVVVAQAVDGEDGPIGRIGVSVDYPREALDEWFDSNRSGPLDAAFAGVARTGEMALLTLRVIGQMVSGRMSLENLSGPLTIAEYAGHSARIGVVQFLSFLAIISISLGVINLLPIPLLDGGHLLYYLLEAVRGRPLSEAAQMVGQRIGLALIFALMGLAIFNDLARLLG